MAYFESGHSSSVQFTENILDEQGYAVISRGLLQVSKESANAYGCQIKNEQDLHNDKININCSVRILNQWVGQKDKVIAGRSSSWFSNVIWLGAARYWSPFRDRAKTSVIANETRDSFFYGNCSCIANIQSIRGHIRLNFINLIRGSLR